MLCLRDFTRKALRKHFASLDAFLRRWKGAERKQAIIDEVAAEGLPLAAIAEEIGKGLDPFDLICHIAFDRPPLTRREWAENVCVRRRSGTWPDGREGSLIPVKAQETDRSRRGDWAGDRDNRASGARTDRRPGDARSRPCRLPTGPSMMRTMPGKAMQDCAGTDLARKLAVLRSPASYPEAPRAVEVRETHMSWVFLTDGFAWKLKKPVRHPFLDYRRLEQRRHFCEEELRLNRRLAPDVYLDVVPLVRRPDGALMLGGAGEAVDWLVRMRRLPASLMLDVALEHGTATPVAVARAADHLASFYASAPPAAAGEEPYLDRFHHEITLNRQTLHDGAYGLPHEAAARVLDTLEGFLGEERDALLVPLRAGRVVEGHGDLRPEHVFLGEPPAVIDCLEFDPKLRLLDPFEEVAFLAMECRMLGGSWAGAAFLRHVAGALRTRPGARLFAFYTGFRACLRARLSIAHLQEPEPREPAKWQPRTLRYLGQAEAACARLRRLPRVR
ncbi:aminoglycoside phosphotransferase family enzyme [Humitalea rosea]|uniref:Aminoglycoside phosphotransferase family enzyme n=1 Tax=Humitalea rosea TaxID=990373 RepID=A0A2W7HVU6_9PROT|nr:type I restriction-modification enzyme R subunit C-terminal domain-containing protein [Humitalea rosea]PZW36952.1 aminoglycoside phosphotransferase family enzyme [Humitalea rosea]